MDTMAHCWNDLLWNFLVVERRTLEPERLVAWALPNRAAQVYPVFHVGWSIRVVEMYS